MRDMAESLVNDFFPFWPIFRMLSLRIFAADGHFSLISKSAAVKALVKSE